MRAILEFLKKYWDILGGTIIGIVSSIIVQWQLEKVQLIYSVIILILVSIGFLKVIINDHNKDKEEKKYELIDLEEENDTIHKIANTQISMKAIKISQNPTQEGEELGKLVLETMKGQSKSMKRIKSFFKWLAIYKEQLIGLLGSIAYAGLTVYAYIYDKFDFILKLFPSTQCWQLGVKIGVGVISLLFLIFGIRNQCKWVGVGSLQTAREYLDQLGNKTISKLSPEAKKVVQNALKTLENSLKQAKMKYNKVLATFEAKKLEIKPVQELINLGVGNQNKLSLQLTQLNQEANTLEVELKEIDKEIVNLQEQISQYQHALSA